MADLILASASASRKALLTAAGVAFIADPADLDEDGLMQRLQGENTQAVAQRLAEAKALHVAARHPGRIVLGGDSVIGFSGRHLSKCATLAAARALLRELSGQTHLLVSAAALARDGVLLWSRASPCRMTMRAFSPQFLEDYLAAEGPAILSSVGCYHFEGRGAQLFDRVDGDYFSVLGLPLLPVLAALRQQDVLPS
ncbi:MAG: septum formation protein Maf [Alphaproteobacteria bacterium 65-7]|nr:MAG: septum formation protein Maf [Alphaproteobacteria bacterium 65-7]